MDGAGEDAGQAAGRSTESTDGQRPIGFGWDGSGAEPLVRCRHHGVDDCQVRVPGWKPDECVMALMPQCARRLHRKVGEAMSAVVSWRFLPYRFWSCQGMPSTFHGSAVVAFKQEAMRGWPEHD